MSEQTNKTEKSHRVRNTIGAAMALIAVGAAVKYGPGLAREAATDQSSIVAGVPGQIESYNDKQTMVRNVPVHLYWLGIEQCPADIDAAKKGELDPSHPSYAPEVGVKNAACNFDWVKVSGSTFNSVKRGESITFDGPVGEPLRK